MSHAKVLVIGDDYDAVLAPYDENLDVAPYWQDISDDYLVFAAEHRYPEMSATSSPEQWRDRFIASDLADLGLLDAAGASPDERAEHHARVQDVRNGYRVHDGRVQERRSDNPQGRWDWYMLGGRWANDLRLKAGSHDKGVRGSVLHGPSPVVAGWCDRARKADVDLDAMRRAGHDAAGERWAAFERARAEHGDWKTLPELIAAEGRETAGRLYNAQPIVAALRPHLGLLESVESEFPPDMTGSEYRKRGLLGAVPGFATVSDQGWWETGRLGWWATHTSEGPAAELNYLQRANDLLDSATNDTWLSVVDIHS